MNDTDMRTATEDMTAVSLFDGIGGFPLALSQAGIRTTAAVEIDKHAAGVVADRLPHIKHFDDVTEVHADDLLATGFDPRRGMLTAGFPCQDLSLAGRRMGLDGARSGLYFEIIRILDELRTASGVLCRWVILENVPGLLSAVCPCPGDGACGTGCTDAHSVRGGACGPGRCIEIHGGAMGAVLGELAQLGYGFAYRVLDAQHFGVPQRRRRVVIVAHSSDRAAPAQVLLEPESRSGDPAAGRAARARTARVLAHSIAITGGQGGLTYRDTAPTVQGGGQRGCRVDAEMAGGGDLVPATAYALQADRDRRAHHEATLIPTEGFAPDDLAYALTARAAQARPEERAATLIPFDSAPFGDTALVDGGPAPTLNTFGQASIVGDGVMGEPIPYDAATINNPTNRSRVTAGDPAPTLNTLGRASVAYAVGGDTTHTLTAEGADASEDGTGRGTPIVAPGLDLYNGAETGDISRTIKAGNASGSAVNAAAVRRLTPVECERLQGYPDGWTATSYGKPSADSQRYRRLGNSIAVPVFHWVALGIAEHEMNQRESEGN